MNPNLIQYIVTWLCNTNNFKKSFVSITVNTHVWNSHKAAPRLWWSQRILLSLKPTPKSATNLTYLCTTFLRYSNISHVAVVRSVSNWCKIIQCWLDDKLESTCRRDNGAFDITTLAIMCLLISPKHREYNVTCGFCYYLLALYVKAVYIIYFRQFFSPYVIRIPCERNCRFLREIQYARY